MLFPNPQQAIFQRATLKISVRLELHLANVTLLRSNISFLVPSKTDVFKNERVAGGRQSQPRFLRPRQFFSLQGIFIVWN